MLLLGQTSILRSNLLGSCSYVVRGFWVDLAINASFMVIAYRLPNLFCFFSAGFKIWNEHSRDSSTLIMAPALSNSPQ